MSFALFPTWIAATLSAAAAVFLNKHLAFSVTAKTKQAGGPGYRYVRVQLITMAVLVVASVTGVVRVITGDAPLVATLITLGWVALDLALLGVVVGAARYEGPGDDVTDPLPATAELSAALAHASGSARVASTNGSTSATRS
jgi:cellulose synthase (UDP-forming)